jgi:hypothetical protein
LKGWREVMAAAAWNGSGIAALEASTGCLAIRPQSVGQAIALGCESKEPMLGKTDANFPTPIGRHNVLYVLLFWTENATIFS